jgi:hypothetical protein
MTRGADRRLVIHERGKAHLALAVGTFALFRLFNVFAFESERRVGVDGPTASSAKCWVVEQTKQEAVRDEV